MSVQRCLLQVDTGEYFDLMHGEWNFLFPYSRLFVIHQQFNNVNHLSEAVRWMMENEAWDQSVLAKDYPEVTAQKIWKWAGSNRLIASSNLSDYLDNAAAVNMAFPDVKFKRGHFTKTGER